MLKRLRWFVIGILCASTLLFAVTQIRQVKIVSSTVDSSPIGSVTPSTGAFTVVSSTGDVQAKRVTLINCTHYAGADSAVTFSGGWGTTASINASVGGCDASVSFTIVSNGTGISSNPTVTVTYKDGAYPTSPIVVCNRNDSSSPLVTSAYLTWTVSPTATVITFNGTPVAGVGYNIWCTATPV